MITSRHRHLRSCSKRGGKTTKQQQWTDFTLCPQKVRPRHAKHILALALLALFEAL